MTNKKPKGRIIYLTYDELEAIVKGTERPTIKAEIEKLTKKLNEASNDVFKQKVESEIASLKKQLVLEPTEANVKKAIRAILTEQGYRVTTTTEQDQKMKEAGDKSYDVPYSIQEEKNNETGQKSGENCADLSFTVLKAGDLNIEKPKAKHFLLSGKFTYPNEQYRRFRNNNKGKVIKPHKTDRKSEDNTKIEQEKKKD